MSSSRFSKDSDSYSQNKKPHNFSTMSGFLYQRLAGFSASVSFILRGSHKLPSASGIMGQVVSPVIMDCSTGAASRKMSWKHVQILEGLPAEQVPLCMSWSPSPWAGASPKSCGLLLMLLVLPHRIKQPFLKMSGTDAQMNQIHPSPGLRTSCVHFPATPRQGQATRDAPV